MLLSRAYETRKWHERHQYAWRRAARQQYARQRRAGLSARLHKPESRRISPRSTSMQQPIGTPDQYQDMSRRAVPLTHVKAILCWRDYSSDVMPMACDMFLAYDGFHISVVLILVTTTCGYYSSPASHRFDYLQTTIRHPTHANSSSSGTPSHLTEPLLEFQSFHTTLPVARASTMGKWRALLY
jgi:hypothetical protein